jgi:hypothetical protein
MFVLLLCIIYFLTFFEIPDTRFKTFHLSPRTRRISFGCILNFSSCPGRVQQSCLWPYLPDCCTRCSFSTTHAISPRVNKKLVLLSTVPPIPAGVLFHVQEEDGDSSNDSRHFNSHVTTYSRNAKGRYGDVCQFVTTGTLICDKH